MKEYRSSIVPFVEEAGVALAESFGKVEAVAFKSSPTDLVTELDRKTEQFLADRFKKLYPDIDFFGEEFGGNDKAERFWLVDPIDGTNQFIRGNPFATTMVSLIESGQVVFALIYNFITKEMCVAEKGKGATMNGEPIHVSGRDFQRAEVGFETNLKKKENGEKFLAVAAKCSIIRTHNSGYEHLLVATGRMEARACLDPSGKDWDYAPGSLLVSEAGGIVRNLGSGSYDFRNHDFIAGNPIVFEELRKILEG